MVLGSWRKMFENGDQGSTQNLDTNLMSIVVWPGEPFSKNVCFGLIYKITMFIFQGTCSQNMFFPTQQRQPGAFRVWGGEAPQDSIFKYFQDLGSPAWLVFQHSQVSVFPGRQVTRMAIFQYFQVPRSPERFLFQYFQVHR